MTGSDPDAGPDQPPPRTLRLRVTITDGRGRVQRADGLCSWLVDIAPRAAKMRSLNRQFRGVDRPTDVLAFPAGTNRHLGDVVIATGVARRQARAAGHPFGTEIRVLALHGLLHLLGYDHERDDGRMARLEQRLRRRGGIA